MKKVFLDVGANVGQTTRAVLDPRYAFDRVVSFEPAPPCWAELERIEDPRVELVEYGLANQTGEQLLYRPGSLDGSIFPSMDSAADSGEPVTVKFVRATNWISENVSSGDIVFMKLNCEGSECDIVEDLLESGELAKCYSVMVDFDVRKIPGLQSRELAVRRGLSRAGYNNVAFHEDVMLGRTPEARVHHWLDTVGARESLPLEDLRLKYSPTLTWLASRKGTGARLEAVLRRQVLARLPPRLASLARSLWRLRRRTAHWLTQRRLDRLARSTK